MIWTHMKKSSHSMVTFYKKIWLELITYNLGKLRFKSQRYSFSLRGGLPRII